MTPSERQVIVCLFPVSNQSEEVKQEVKEQVKQELKEEVKQEVLLFRLCPLCCLFPVFWTLGPVQTSWCAHQCPLTVNVISMNKSFINLFPVGSARKRTSRQLHASVFKVNVSSS